MISHVVVGGRLSFLDSGATPLHTAAETQGANADATRPTLVLRDRLFLVAETTGMEKLAPQYVGGSPPGHPDPESLIPLGNSTRQEQLQRIQDAASLVDEGPTTYLRQHGRLYLVDSGEVFVADTDQVLRAAIGMRLSQGHLQAPRPLPIIPAVPPPANLFRVAPVGDTGPEVPIPPATFPMFGVVGGGESANLGHIY